MGAFFSKDASLELIPAISLKRNASAEVFPSGFFRVTLLKLSENFLRGIFAKYFLTKSKAIGCEFNGNNVFDKNIYN